MNPTVRRQVIENVLASWHGFIGKFGHLDTSLADSVWFEHSAPEDDALLEVYQASFNCEVLFDQAASGFWFKEELLDIKLPQADKKLLKTLLDHATQLLADIDRDRNRLEGSPQREHDQQADTHPQRSLPPLRHGRSSSRVLLTLPQVARVDQLSPRPTTRGTSG